MANQTRILITVLILVIVVLAGVMVYAFLIKPQINGYITRQQNTGAIQGASVVLSQLISAAAQCPPGGVPVPIDNNGRAVHLVALECYQPQAQQQVAPQQ